LKSFPDASSDWTTEQTRTQWANYRRWSADRSSLSLLSDAVPSTYFVTAFWALTIVSLGVTEVLTLVWLANHHAQAGDWPALAWLSVVSCGLGMILLLTVPTLRLLWFEVPSISDQNLPDSFRDMIERKFGLPADASEEERRRWLAMMSER
jgi:hypothetical protein